MEIRSSIRAITVRACFQHPWIWPDWYPACGVFQCSLSTSRATSKYLRWNPKQNLRGVSPLEFSVFLSVRTHLCCISLPCLSSKFGFLWRVSASSWEHFYPSVRFQTISQARGSVLILFLLEFLCAVLSWWARNTPLKGIKDWGEYYQSPIWM